MRYQYYECPAVHINFERPCSKSMCYPLYFFFFFLVYCQHKNSLAFFFVYWLPTTHKTPTSIRYLLPFFFCYPLNILTSSILLILCKMRKNLKNLVKGIKRKNKIKKISRIKNRWNNTFYFIFSNLQQCKWSFRVIFNEWHSCMKFLNFSQF